MEINYMIFKMAKNGGGHTFTLVVKEAGKRLALIISIYIRP
jgi:hypothetical protein